MGQKAFRTDVSVWQMVIWLFWKVVRPFWVLRPEAPTAVPIASSFLWVAMGRGFLWNIGCVELNFFQRDFKNILELFPLSISNLPQLWRLCCWSCFRAPTSGARRVLWWWFDYILLRLESLCKTSALFSKLSWEKYPEKSVGYVSSRWNRF